MNEELLTREKLIELSQKAGFKPSENQIERWHKADLLPRPTKIALGRGRGTISVYPTETTYQLFRLFELRKKERRLDQLRWQLWLENYEIPIKAIKTTVFKTVRALEKSLGTGQDPFDIAEEMALKALKMKRRPSFHGLLDGRKMKNEDLESFLILMLNMIFGGELSFEDAFMPSDMNELPLEGVFEVGLELDRARTDTINGVGPWLTESIKEPLSQLPHIMNPSTLRNVLEEASDVEMIKARQDFLVWSESFPIFVNIAERIKGANAFGYGLFRDIKKLHKSAGLQGQTYFLLVLLSFRKNGMGVGMDFITEALEQNMAIMKIALEQPELLEIFKRSLDDKNET